MSNLPNKCPQKVVYEQNADVVNFLSISHYRPNNILPYDYKRVHLQSITEYGDYINACWMTSDCDKYKIISSQSPLPMTVPHYLQMIQENDVSVIVVLTKEEEQHDAEGRQM